MLGVAGVALVVAAAVAAYWFIFGGAKAAMNDATAELFKLLDKNGNGVVDAQELQFIAELYLEETCDGYGKAEARACMQELHQSVANSNPDHGMNLSEFSEVVKSGKLKHAMERLKNIKACVKQRADLAFQRVVEAELDAAQVELTEAIAHGLAHT